MYDLDCTILTDSKESFVGKYATRCAEYENKF
jgi:hypothetical protein